MKTGICKLCGESKELCTSHIFPDFVYRTMKTENRLLAINGAGRGDPVRIIQTGYTEPLLCRACEALLNTRYEQPAQNFWWALSGEPTAPDITVEPLALDGRASIMRGFDYKSIKLFFISLLWRAGVSTRYEFSCVSLGPHEPRLRAMLLNEDPGTARDYPCCVLTLSNDSQTIMCPAVHRQENHHRVYRFLICKVLLMFPVASHRGAFDYSLFSPREDGVLVTVEREFKSLPEFDYAASWIRKTDFPAHRLDLLLKGRRPQRQELRKGNS
jgi:hypothetical protein